MNRTWLTGAAGMVTLVVAVVMMAMYAPASHARPGPAHAALTAYATHPPKDTHPPKAMHPARDGRTMYCAVAASAHRACG